MFLHVQSTQTLKVDSPCFFQTSFFDQICTILTLMIRKEKGFELMKIIFITNLSTFGSKMFLTLKIMDFENVHVTKVIHVYMIEGMNAQYI
jgi:hypothetical protein